MIPVIKRLGIPSLLGYLLAGLLIAPLFSLIFDSKLQIAKLIEVSLCFFAFYLGVQIQPKRIFQTPSSIKPSLIYTTITGLIFSLVVWFAFQLPISISILSGFALTLSSNLLIQQIITKDESIDPKSVQLSLSTLHVQNAIAVLLLAIVPLFSLNYTAQQSLAYIIALVAVISGFLLFNRYILRPLFKIVAEQSISELSIVLVAFVMVCTFAITQFIGMPVLLSALLSGLILADSDLKLNLENYMQPLLGLILSLAALSIGLMIDINSIASHLPEILLCILSITIIKFATLLAINFIKYRRLKPYCEGSTLLTQASEYALIIFACTAYYQLIPLAELSAFVLIIIFTMLLTPINLWLVRYFGGFTATHVLETANHEQEISKENTIIIGFGRFGQLIARVAHIQQQPFIVVDRRFEVLNFIKQYGGQYIQGNISDQAVIDTLPLASAKVCVIAIDEVEDSLLIARHIRLHFPQLSIIIRARDHQHMHLLQDLGIEHIYIEAQELALEMSKQMLTELGTDQVQVNQMMKDFSQYNDELLKQKQHIPQNSNSLMQSHRNLIVEIENLFENDAFMLRQKTHSANVDIDGVNLTHQS